eukprot:3245475-Prymnesium_polylepis.1
MVAMSCGMVLACTAVALLLNEILFQDAMARVWQVQTAQTPIHQNIRSSQSCIRVSTSRVTSSSNGPMVFRLLRAAGTARHGGGVYQAAAASAAGSAAHRRVPFIPVDFPARRQRELVLLEASDRFAFRGTRRPQRFAGTRAMLPSFHIPATCTSLRSPPAVRRARLECARVHNADRSCACLYSAFHAWV